MPVDNLGQTFRFIVEQAGGGGGGASDSTGGAGGSPGRVARDANQYRDTMAKMVKAVDHSGKTTQDAFTKGFRAVGLQITMANMLKQSQIFTGTLNAIFQVIGALFDIVLAPFMPLIVKFMQKAIPRLLDFAERMAAWVRGELAQLDELGFMGYIQKKLEEDIPKAFETFGPVVAAQIGIASKFIINAIPGTVAIALTSLGILTAEVLGATVSGIGELLVLTLDKSLDAMAHILAFLMDKMAGLRIPLGAGKVWEPFSEMRGAGDTLREGTEGLPDWLTKMKESTIPELAESVKTLTKDTFDWAADIFRSATAVDLFEELSVIVQDWVEKGVIGVFDATASAAGELGGELDSAKFKIGDLNTEVSKFKDTVEDINSEALDLGTQGFTNISYGPGSPDWMFDPQGFNKTPYGPWSPDWMYNPQGFTSGTFDESLYVAPSSPYPEDWMNDPQGITPDMFPVSSPSNPMDGWLGTVAKATTVGLVISVILDRGSGDVVDVSDTKVTVKNGEKHQIDVQTSDPQGIGKIP